MVADVSAESLWALSLSKLVWLNKLFLPTLLMVLWVTAMIGWLDNWLGLRKGYERSDSSQDE